MRVITIVSPDKISLSMFTDYYRHLYTLKDLKILDVNSLLSAEIQENLISIHVGYAEKGDSDLLIRYKTKTKNNSINCDKLQEISNYIIKFDMFSTCPEVLKSTDEEYIRDVLKGWGIAVDKLSK